MNPEDFLKLTTGYNQRARAYVEDWSTGWAANGEFDFAKMGANYNYVPIQLNISEEDKEVYGHEGRHR